MSTCGITVGVVNASGKDRIELAMTPGNSLHFSPEYARLVSSQLSYAADHIDPLDDQEHPVPFDFHAHLARQAAWSIRTFGPGDRAKGVVDHIRKELLEIEKTPGDLEEWIDVVILALDGAWRSGATPEQIVAAIVAKQTKNEKRNWPDWRTADPDKAIEHVKGGGMTPDKALELVLRYASLTAEIKRQKKCIGDHLDKCLGISGKRSKFIEPLGEVDSKGRELDLHLTQWYTPDYNPEAYDGYTWMKIGQDEADECPHCYGAHLAIQARKTARKQLAAVKGAISRARQA